MSCGQHQGGRARRWWDGRVSEAEVERALAAANDLYDVLSRIHSYASEVDVGTDIAARLEMESWAAQLGTLELPRPTTADLGEWMNVIDSWAGSASRELGRLRNAVLDVLLATEGKIAAAARGDASALSAPPGSPRIPASYAMRPIGSERERQTRLGWWDRFQTADGAFPAALRLVVAGAIVAAVVLGARAATDAAELASTYQRYR